MFEIFRREYMGMWAGAIAATEMTLDEAGRHWAKRLEPYDDEVIAKAAEQWDGDGPPNLAQFRNLCKALQPAAIHRPFRALPDPEDSRTEAQEGRGALEKAAEHDPIARRVLEGARALEQGGHVIRSIDEAKARLGMGKRGAGGSSEGAEAAPERPAETPEEQAQREQNRAQLKDRLRELGVPEAALDGR